MLTASSFALLLYAARAYVDVPFLAVVLWAGVLEAERPRRGTSVMALLAVAGLLRPEAWILAGAYWLWMVWERDPRRGAATCIRACSRSPPSGPLGWALTDVWATGDPLFSLHATSDLAGELQRERGIAHVPGAFVRFLADALRPPVFLAALAGLALATWRRAGTAVHVPLALLGAGTLAFVVTGVAGPVDPAALPHGPGDRADRLRGLRDRRLGGAARGRPAPPAVGDRRSASARVLGAGFVVARISVVDRFTNEVRFIRGTHDDLAAILADPAVRRGRACGPVTLPNYRLVPGHALDPRRAADRRSARGRRCAARTASRCSSPTPRCCGASGSRRARAR